MQPTILSFINKHSRIFRLELCWTFDRRQSMNVYNIPRFSMETNAWNNFLDRMLLITLPWWWPSQLHQNIMWICWMQIWIMHKTGHEIHDFQFQSAEMLLWRSKRVALVVVIELRASVCRRHLHTYIVIIYIYIRALKCGAICVLRWAIQF